MFVALSKPSQNPLKLFLDGARNPRFVPNPKQIEITDNKNSKISVQETFVTCVTFVNEGYANCCLAKLKRTNILYVIIISTVAIDAVLHQLQLTNSVSNFIRYTV